MVLVHSIISENKQGCHPLIKGDSFGVTVICSSTVILLLLLLNRWDTPIKTKLQRRNNNNNNNNNTHLLHHIWLNRHFSWSRCRTRRNSEKKQMPAFMKQLHIPATCVRGYGLLEQCQHRISWQIIWKNHYGNWWHKWNISPLSENFNCLPERHVFNVVFITKTIL